MELINFLKHSIVSVIPSSMRGEYYSENNEYRALVSRYYPADGNISIGSMRDDKRNYGKDMHVVLHDYKKAALKEINKRELILK